MITERRVWCLMLGVEGRTTRSIKTLRLITSNFVLCLVIFDTIHQKTSVSAHWYTNQLEQ